MAYEVEETEVAGFEGEMMSLFRQEYIGQNSEESPEQECPWCVG